MLDFRTYSLTDDESVLAKVREDISRSQTSLKKAMTHAEKYNLDQLRASISHALEQLLQYEQSINETARSIEALNRIKANLENAATAYLNAASSFVETR